MKAQNYLKWGLIVSGIIILGIFLLNTVGQRFIQEIIQEVSIEEEERKSFGVSIGQEAPHWELLDLEDNTVTLSDFLGEPFIITFWTSWNSISADQLTIFDKYLSQNPDILFKIISINSQEDKSIVSSFIQRGGYQVPTLLDETGEIGELYKVRTLPLTYFLDKEGVIRDVFGDILSEQMLMEKVQKIIR